MADFGNMLPALENGEKIRRDVWEGNSVMYSDCNRQLMRTPNKGAMHNIDYNWVLDLTDIIAKDWQVVKTTSTGLENLL